MSVEFSDIGLPVAPGSARVDTLAYCSAAASVLVRLALLEDGGWRFFVRGLHEVRYREIVAVEPQFAFRRDLAVATDAPFAFVMLRDQSTNDSSVFAVKLPDGSLKRLPDPSGYSTERIWISQVLASASDATWLQVVAAEISPRDDGGYSVIYSLARMNVSTGHLDKVADLSTPFA